MLKNELEEASGILSRALQGLLASLPPGQTQAISDARVAIGDLNVNAVTEISAGAVGADLGECFRLVGVAGATFDAFDRIRIAGEAEEPITLPGESMAAAVVRFCLVEQSIIVSNTAFVSRDDVDTMFDRIDPAFESATLYASDVLDSATYMSLTALFGSVVNDLATRSRPLPRMITYAFADSMPALWLAYRLYADATRAQELIAENKVVHPAFMPRTGRALSA